MVVMLILVAVLGVFSLAVIRVMRGFAEIPAPYRASLGVFAVAGLTTALLGLSGRPEPLAMLIILTGFLAITRVDVRRQWIPAGIALGLFGVTSPLPAAIGFVLFALYMHARLGRRDALVGVVGAGGSAALVALSIIFLWYPYSLTDWLAGLRTHWASTDSVLKDVVHYWFTNPRNSFYGLLFLLALTLGFLRLGRHRAVVKSKAGFAVSLAVLFIIAAEARLYSPGINYNLVVFSPLVYLAVIFAGLARCRDEAAVKGARRLCPVVTPLILAVFLMTSLGFARTVVTFPAFLQRGVSYAEARVRLEDLRGSASGSILITPAIFGLVDDYQGISVMVLPHHAVPKTHEFVVFSQVGLARRTPPEIDGYVLIEDRFDRDAPRVFGVKVANSTHGYDYAIYRRETGTSAPADAASE
jgi:hypothetical protein